MIVGLMMTLLPGAVRAQDKIIKSHGYSYFGELKYPADFKHFDYVNPPDAPKGGEISIAVSGTFNSLNPLYPQGKATARRSGRSMKACWGMVRRMLMARPMACWPRA